MPSIRTDGRCLGDIPDSGRRVTNASGSMPLLSTVIRPTAFFSSHSDETTLGADHAHRLPSQCARRQNRPAMDPIPAEPVDHPLSHRVRQKSYASVVVVRQRGRRSRPIAAFHPPSIARKSRLIYVSILPPSTASRRQGHFFPVTLNA